MNGNKNTLELKRMKENIVRSNKKYMYLICKLVITWIGIVWYNAMLAILRKRKKIVKNYKELDTESCLVYIDHIHN